MGIVALTGVEEVGIRRVHPPCIATIVIECLQMLPIDITRHGTEGIVDLHTRGIVHHRWPDMGDATLWPRFDRQQQALLIKFTELLGVRPEARPDGNHEVGMLLMDILDQLGTAGKILCQKVHGVPKIVATPILPVLDDAVEGHLQLAILIYNTLRLGSRLITLLRLPVAKGPQWEHGHIAREVAHLGNHTVGRAAVHEVVVYTLTCLRVEGHAIRIVLKQCWRIVFPIDTPALDTLDDILEILQVRLFHTLLLTTTVHFTILEGT